MTLLSNYEENWAKYANEASDVYENKGDLQGVLFQYAICNYQVCNGGFSQYFMNGYASSVNEGCFSVYSDIDQHDKMVEKLKIEFPELKGNDLFEKMIKILSDFSMVEIDLDRTLEEEMFEDGEYWVEEVENDEYGQMDSFVLNLLDDRFYEIYKEFEELLNETLEVKATK